MPTYTDAINGAYSGDSGSPCAPSSKGGTLLSRQFTNIRQGTGFYPGAMICPEAPFYCTGSASTSEAPASGTWQHAISVFAAQVMGCTLAFDSYCGVAGLDAAEAWETYSKIGTKEVPHGLPTTLLNLWRRAPCTRECSTTETDDGPSGTDCQCRASFLPGVTTVPAPSTKIYYPQGAVSAFAYIAYEISKEFTDEAHAADRISEIQWNYCSTMPTTPSFSSSGLWTNGAYTVTIAENTEAQRGWQNMLNAFVNLLGRTCACCTAKADGTKGEADGSSCSLQTEMCGGMGWCQTESLVLDMGSCTGVSTVNFSATPGSGGTAASCRCPNGFTGAACNVPKDDQCPVATNGKVCGGASQGSCNKADGYNRCYCSDGWGGVSCDAPLCAYDDKKATLCSGNGDCKRGVCQCSPGFTGVDCSQATKPLPVPGPAPEAVKPGFLGGSSLTTANSAKKSAIYTAGGVLIGLLLLIVGASVLIYYLLSSRYRRTQAPRANLPSPSSSHRHHK